METLIGFVVGFMVGTQQGRDGLARMRSSVDAIRNSPQTRQAVVTGIAIAGSAAKQVLGGGAGAVLTGAVDAFSRKAGAMVSAVGTEDRAA